jgi:hypothetical protein
VLLNVSLGPKPAEGAQPVVPDVTGQDEATATQDLQAAGYQVEVVDQKTSDESEPLQARLGFAGDELRHRPRQSKRPRWSKRLSKSGKG